MTQYDIQAIDTVVNIWTPETLAIRPNRDAFFGGKMNVADETLKGVALEEMLRRMDAAGIERAFLNPMRKQHTRAIHKTNVATIYIHFSTRHQR